MEKRIHQRPDTSQNKVPRELISLEQLKAIAKYGRGLDKLIQPLNDTLLRYGIDTPLRISHFLGQVIHESGSFRYMKEIASGKAYEGRKDLGNTQKGDGVRFKGRAYLQLTGRSNYTQYSDFCNEDFISHPEKVEELPWAIDVAGWFWSTRGLNEIADTDNLRRITKRINGGYTHIDDRIKWTDQAKKVLL